MQPITEPDVLAGYLTDASNIHGQAEGLFRPTTTAEVSEIVREANRSGTPLTVTAGRTSTTAAAVPMGGWVLSTERLSTIEHIGVELATAQAGVILGEFQTAIEATGRLYPPDPTSRHDCALGASIATNASGARSFKYGPTRPWVESVEVVLPTGEVLTATRDTPVPADWPVPRWTEPSVKTAAGYVPPKNLLDLFIGQEGTLGILTRATVRLCDLPDEVLGFIVFFSNRADAVGFMKRARSAQRADGDGPVSPRCLEYLDRHCLDLARDRVGDIPDEAQAALFCEQEVSLDEDTHLQGWWELLEQTGALADDTIVTTDDAGRENLQSFRHAIPAGVNEEVVRNGMPKVGTDLSVPDDALDTLMDAYEAAPIRHVLFGHIGDNHLHLNLLPRDEEELTVAKAYYDQLAAQAVALGGSVSAEHGIGKTKREHLRTMVGPQIIEQFRRLKSHLDPQWILGRGNVIEPPL